MQPSDQDIRAFLITEAFQFVDQIILLPGIKRIAMLGSLTTAKTDPKDIDILITVDDDTALTKLATAARRLKGIAQSKNKGADIFLANTKGQYIARLLRKTSCLFFRNLNRKAIICENPPPNTSCTRPRKSIGAAC